MNMLLVIDDDPLVLNCIRHVFPQNEYALQLLLSAKAAIQSFQTNRPDVVLCDVRLPDRNGLELLADLHAIDAKVPVIMMTGFGTSETAIEAMRRGAYDYLLKPLDPTVLEQLVDRAITVSRLMRVPMQISQEKVGTSGDPFIGSSPAMQEVFKSIGRVAPTHATVLILGESGTGKELVARAIYQHSKRSSKPFLAINCAAIPENLLESELFGHERGAFTGADRKRIGKFEQCNGGTLFLDEIGDMTPLTQAKILRVLQDQQFERVGGNETLRSDVRIIAATNRNIEAMMVSAAFREDLYYRLNVCTINLPPLRERISDLSRLVEYFLDLYSREFGKSVRTVSADALVVMQSYQWPGNIRELQSVLKQALLRTTGPMLLEESLPAALRQDTQGATITTEQVTGETQLLRFIRQRVREGSTNLYAEVQERVERDLLTEVMIHTNGNISQAAQLLGISRPTLRSKLESFGLTFESKLVASTSS